jgi:tRNA nucleotidyltransferase (CCA-adding enzyme)
MSVSSVRTQVAAKLRPRLAAGFVEKQLHLLEKTLHKYAPEVQMVPGGSFAKGTFINGSHDIDVFIRFPIGTTDATMVATLKRAFPRGAVLHGSREYLQVTRGGFVFELVPVLAIDKWQEAQNSMDMSPFHITYVQLHMNPQLQDDARLAKQFTKAAGVYGAESFIRGFSGYVLELLTIYYGGFENFLRAATQWQEQTILDPAKHYKSTGEALRRLNEAKIVAPLVLIDPVQPDRNAAAALSTEAYERFRARAAAFLKKPSATFFDTKLTKATIKATWKGKKVLFVTPRTPKGKRDIVGCKVLARHEKAIQLFHDHEFPLVHAEWRFGEKESLCWYVLERTTLPALREQRGPPDQLKESVSAFRKKHPKAALRAGIWYASVKRRYTKAQDVLSVAWRGMRT